MKATQFLKTAMFTTGIMFIPTAFAGEGVTVGVPDDDAPIVVEKVKDGKGVEVPAEDPIILPEITPEHEADMWPRLHSILKDQSRNPELTLLAILKQRSWKPSELYLIVRTAIIANPSIADKIETIMKEAGISDDVIRVIIDTLRNDDGAQDGGVPIGGEQLDQPIPTPDPITSTH